MADYLYLFSFISDLNFFMAQVQITNTLDLFVFVETSGIAFW